MPAEHGERPSGARQKLLNESWPPGTTARAIKDAPQAIKVTARLVWEDDGVEYLDTRALRWSRHHVFVAIHDRRVRGLMGIWLDPSDVRRRGGDRPNSPTERATEGQ